MSDERYELPEGWLWARIGDVVVDAQPGFASGRKGIVGGIRHLRMNNIGPNCMLDLSQVTMVPADLARQRHLLRPGDVLFCHTNSQKLVGKTALFNLEDGPYAFSNHLTRLRLPADGPPPQWLWYFLATLWRDRYFETRCKQWVNQATVERDTLLSTAVPMAPLAEQRRIVAKIEALFEQSRTARQALDRIPLLLKKFRQAVLAAAFRGDLTRDWREQHPDVEPSSVLLERIRAERRRKWEGDLRAKGKARRQEEYEETMTLELVGLERLPDRWVWSTIGQLFDVSTGGTPSRKKAAYWNGSIPWVSSGEVAFSRISDTREKITEEGLSNSNAKVHPLGTVLLAMIGEGKTRGQSAILDISASTNQNVAAILCADSAVPSEFVYYWLRYHYEETRTFGEGGAQPALNAKKVRTLPVPLPPLAEQRTIIEQLSTLFDHADAIEAAVEAARRRTDKIEQSILARAFRGELVPQDLNDEPASTLLDRVRTQPSVRASTARLAIHIGRGKK